MSIGAHRGPHVRWRRRGHACLVAFFCNTHTRCLARPGAPASAPQAHFATSGPRMRHIACTALSLFATPGFASGISGVNPPAFALAAAAADG
ncbi:protein of unknown function (plasmid) [Cupriavidus taiwanensis]|uniref:Uncharacterized protein n=1 Tax=Cupriavidus taiwanensis TaxID=164546 RepID=A0A375IRM5_9BURK|nr:protein of unknown function [Cupriavidus taiwanensis]